MNAGPIAKAREPICNLEAEQALLGAVLYDNSAFERVTEALLPEHFFDPPHQRLWEAMASTIRAGKLCDAVLLAGRMRDDAGFEELGGVSYLALLIDHAPPAVHAADYGAEVRALAQRRQLAWIGAETVLAAETLHAVPVTELVEEMESRLYGLAENKAQQGFRAFTDNLAGALANVAAAIDRDGGLAGLSTGLIDLDKKLGGLHPSDLYILAGRPSMGKTALATNIAFSLASHYAYETLPDGRRKTLRGGIVGFFSLEMSGEQLALRILAQAARISSDKLRKGEVEAHEFGRVRDSAQLIDAIPLHVDATGGLSIAQLCARARRLKRTVGLDLIVVDYLQLVTASKARHGANRVEEVSEITQGLKALAKELNVPVLALSQLSRKVEERDDKRPQLADLRESGSIEQDADVVMFVYREEYYLGRTEPKAGTSAHEDWQMEMAEAIGKAEVIIGKQRHGPIGNVRLSFAAEHTQFGNLEREQHHAQQRLPHASDDQ